MDDSEEDHTTLAVLSCDSAPFIVTQVLTSGSPHAGIISPEHASFLVQNYHIYSTLDTLDLLIHFSQVLISITVQGELGSRGVKAKVTFLFLYIFSNDIQK